VLNHHECHPGFGRQMREQLRKRLQSAGGSPDSDDGEALWRRRPSRLTLLARRSRVGIIFSCHERRRAKRPWGRYDSEIDLRMRAKCRITARKMPELLGALPLSDAGHSGTAPDTRETSSRAQPEACCCGYAAAGDSPVSKPVLLCINDELTGNRFVARCPQYRG